MDKYQNKYRIASARAAWWDYGWNGAYFITICTQDRKHFFGKIEQSQSILSSMGQIAEANWQAIPSQFPYAELGDFVVMPNHIHGILILDKPQDLDTTVNMPPSTQPTEHKKPGGKTGDNNPMLNTNISRIIRWYKGRSSFEIRKKHTEFAWHPRFYDHIIRNDRAYQRISDYIINNPTNWGKDKFHSSP